tara:strand:- start:4053 stop:4838 length:786 start_codon:yes stop_codon:yes gene_type:complete
MLNSENILCVEYALNETLLKVTYKENNDVCMYQMPNQPNRKQYQAIKQAGWTPDKIRKQSKKLESLDDEYVKLTSRISDGYTLAKEELEKIRVEKDILVAEKIELKKELEKIRAEKDSLYDEHKLAIETLHDLYNEQKDATSTLKNLYSEQNDASNRVAELYDEYGHAQIDQEKRFSEKIKTMKMKMQENYDKYQELYGANVLDVIFEDNEANKEFLFKAKLEVLARQQFKNVDRSIRTKIRKAKTVKELLMVIYDVIEDE